MSKHQLSAGWLENSLPQLCYKEELEMFVQSWEFSCTTCPAWRNTRRRGSCFGFCSGCAELLHGDIWAPGLCEDRMADPSAGIKQSLPRFLQVVFIQ